MGLRLRREDAERRYAVNEIEKAQQEITEAREKLTSAEARRSALSKTVAREYRAGEWVPALKSEYWVNDENGDTYDSNNDAHPFDEYRIRTGNAFPTDAIAEAAKAHTDWWREFDKIRDEAVGETARAEMYLGRITYTTPPFHIGPTSVERLGGEQKVIEMLNAGRVFRFKWGGQ